MTLEPPRLGYKTSKSLSQALEACVTPTNSVVHEDCIAKPWNSEVMDKATVKNGLSEWVQAKQVHFPSRSSARI